MLPVLLASRGPVETVSLVAKDKGKEWGKAWLGAVREKVCGGGSRDQEGGI